MGHATTSLALSAVLLLGASGCSGIDAGIDYPSDLPGDLGPQLLTPENGPDPGLGFSRFKIAPDACKGIDTHAITQPLNQDDLSRFLEGQGLKLTAKKARGNLYWYDFPNGREAPNNFVRLRLAVLDDTAGAAKDLHASLLEHGPGWWGVRRSNLAVLAPRASLHDAMAFALKHKLVCWGVFTIAGNDDAYVVPGPYSEL
jgi:hypothetical protein